MQRGDREPRQDFEPNEMLFYRLEQFYELGSHPSGLSIRRPEFSVNREKHGGQAMFVLIPNWLNHGVAEFKHADIPGPLDSSGGNRFSWKVAHEPENDNYYHSEVRTYRHNARAKKSSQINDEVWRVFKQLLSEKMIVIKSSVVDQL